jgi:hypothetical protein
MEVRKIKVQRWSITSQKSLESVVASVEANVGKPNMTNVGARIARRKRLRKSKTLLAADGDKSLGLRPELHLSKAKSYPAMGYVRCFNHQIHWRDFLIA